MTENIITGIDIGSSNIRIVVGQPIKMGEAEQLNIIGVVEVPAQGMKKGDVVSIEDVVSCISACLEKAERMIGLPIERACVGVSGTHIVSQESTGVIAISRTNGEVQENDIARVIEAAKSVAQPVNYDILHVIPKTFSVDNQTGVKDPIGMSGIRLEVATQVIRGGSLQVKNLTKCVYRTGIDIRDLVLSILAASEAVLSTRQKELGVALVDMGAATTKIIIFEEGDILHTAVLPIGADHITKDLMLGLQAPFDVAERIKLDIGSALPQNFDKSDEINLRDFGGENQVFSKKYIACIIEARVEEIFCMIDAELKKINRSGLLPSGIVLIGGGAKLPGMVEAGRRKTLLSVSLGVSRRFNTAVDKVNDLTFATALGLVMWGYGAQAENGPRSSGGVGNQIKFIKGIADKIKRWFNNLIS